MPDRLLLLLLRAVMATDIDAERVVPQAGTAGAADTACSELTAVTAATSCSASLPQPPPMPLLLLLLPAGPAWLPGLPLLLSCAAVVMMGERRCCARLGLSSDRE